MGNNTEVYIASHKLSSFPNKTIYLPLQVGAALNKHFTLVCDDAGDNISKKNPSYCELTGLYWIWKNSKASLVGLVHYRRYFFKSITNSLNNVLSFYDIQNLLDNNQMIVPNKDKLIRFSSVYSAWVKIHNKKDWDDIREIISVKYPDYLSSFDKFSQSRSFYTCNMFICRKDIIDGYCKWLFDILLMKEKITNLEQYDNYNKRLYGFLGERLFNVWILKNNIKTVEVPVFNTDKNFFAQRLEYYLKKYLPFK